MRSDSPQPTSRFQTLLQPELEDLPILKGRLALPNLLSTPEVPDTVKPEEPEPVDPSDPFVDRGEICGCSLADASQAASTRRQVEPIGEGSV